MLDALMMMRTWFLVSILVACGGTPAPPPKQAPPPPPPPVAVVKPPPPQPCEVAAQVLVKEHHLDKMPDAKREQARRAGEAEVVAACLDDQWPTAAIDCMSARAAPSSCFGQLEAMQERRINRDLDGWERKWSKPDGTGYGGDTYGGGDPDGIGKMGKMTPPPREEWISCEPSVGDPANYDPIIKADAVDRDYAIKVRRDLLHETCNLRWSNTDKKCFGAAQTAVAVAACRASLDEASRNAIANSIADAAGRLGRVAALKKNASAISCKAVSLVRYSDDAWAGRLATLVAAERTRIITESRAKMVATCTSDKWSAMERACIIVGGGRREMEMADCFHDNHTGMMVFRWGFPPSGVIYKSGIPDCDALGEIVKKLVACDKIDKDQRASMADMFSMQLGMWADVSADRRADVAKQCKDSQRMYSEHGREKGCAM